MPNKHDPYVLSFLIVLCLPFVSSRVAPAQQIWSTHDGFTTITFDGDLLARMRVEIEFQPGKTPPNAPSTASVEIDADSPMTFSVGEEGRIEFVGGALRHLSGLQIRTPAGSYALDQLVLRETPTADVENRLRLVSGDGSGGLILGRFKVGLDPVEGTLTIHSPDLRVSSALAAALNRPDLADVLIGSVTIRARAEWVGGTGPMPVVPSRPGNRPRGRAAGPDMTFCQLADLAQFGRVGDVVGLALTTTSWNVGDADLMWFASPQSEHPFIVMNLYRLMNDRFEQIGQSSIKHGFYALGSTQCGGNCTYEPGHGVGDWLGVGCTDTYSSGLNASQSGLAPRYEVNPWTGSWTYAGSHFAQGYHSHDAIEHRLQVTDSDLDPAQNPGASYFAEGYYVILDDINVMNSATWKPVTVVAGAPGSTWTFGMSGASTPPQTGFAISAWEATGAKLTTLAQEVPPIEFVSPDGRCVLATKVTALGGGIYHYEYALLNIDMDRKVGSFSIPLAPGVPATNIGFHAVRSHDDPSVSNTPWSVSTTSTQITWSTVDNPLSWGTLYNFRFDTAAPPVGNTTVTLGLYDPGTPATVTGITYGPDFSSPDCNANGIDDACDIDCGSPGGPCDVPGCGGSLDCQPNGIPDECEADCNTNSIPDDCDISAGTSLDCQPNGIPDECEADCNTNTIPDDCDIASGTSPDCDGNGVPDECQPGLVCDNDTCVQATVICPGTYSGGTASAGSDGSATCGNSGGAPDVWFSYTPASDGAMTVETCIGSTTFDTVLSVHSGCPGTTVNELACNDDACGLSQSQINLAVTAGTTYLIRVSGNAGAAGDFTLTLTGPPCSTQPVRGGRLWDRWWAVNGAPVPTGTHPLYPPAGGQIGSDTYRCKECHGWDYKGAAGAYGSGSHYTGIPGVYGSTRTAVEMFDLIKRDDIPNGHGFSNYGLSDQDIWDLVQFMQDLVIDTDLYIDVNGVFMGDALQGQMNYTTGSPSCIVCHGADGTILNFGTPQSPEWVGTVAYYNPWEMLHKVRVGQPGTSMPSWIDGGGTDQGAADIGLYCAATFPVDCLNAAHCDDGDPCNGIETCQGGFCVPDTLDGDMDFNGTTDGSDVQYFVNAVMAGSTDPNDCAHGDFSGNGVIDENDLGCMVARLLAP